jgi:drug/metabolite transporter (DMT)-like permease
VGAVEGRAQAYVVRPVSRRVNGRSSVASTFALLSFIWGSTWLAIKLGVEAVPTFLSVMLRFGMASLVLLTLASVFRRKLPRSRSEWGIVFFVGIALFLGDYGLIYWAEANGLESGLTAILFAMMPLLTAVAAHALIPRERLTLQKLLGIAVGFGGVALIFRGQLATAGLGKALPMLAVVLASGFAGTSTAAMRRWARDIDSFVFNGLAMGIGSLGLAAVSLGTGERWSVPSWPGGLLPILYLGLVGSVVAFVAYHWLLQHVEATTGSFILLVTPIVALALGVVLANETVDAIDLLGTAVTLAGLWISLSRRSAGHRIPSSRPQVSTQEAREQDASQNK